MNLDLAPLERALAQLAEALEVHEAHRDAPDRRLTKHLRAAVIQAFEFTWELSFKMIRRRLADTAANPAALDAMDFGRVIREALRRGLVRSEVADWRRYRTLRGTTSHTYSESKAQEVFECAPGFLEEARFLVKALERGQVKSGESG